MASKLPRYYWDSCVFIDAIQKTSGRIEHIRSIEAEARRNKLQIVASTLAIAEVAKTKSGTLTEEQARLIASYFENDFIIVVQVDRPVAKRASDHVRNHPIKPPDAIHVATAIRAGVDVLYTYDGDGQKPGLLQLDGQIGNLAIKTPDHFASDTLFKAP